MAQFKTEDNFVHLGISPKYGIECTLTVPSDELPTFRARSCSFVLRPESANTAPTPHGDG